MKDTIINSYNTRFYYRQKTKFIKYIQNNFDNVNIQKRLLLRNIIIGDPKKAKIIVMAHYDTPPNMALMLFFSQYFGTVLSQFIILILILLIMFLTSALFGILGLNFVINLLLIIMILQLIIPNKNNTNDNTSGTIMTLLLAQKYKNNNDICFVLTDFEEYGLFGSLHFKQKYYSKQEVVVLDCVASGDEIAIINTSIKNKTLSNFFKNNSKYKIKTIKSKIIASDNMTFGTKATLISSVSNSKFYGFHIPNMHTNSDIIFDENIFNDIKDTTIKYLDEKIRPTQ